MANRQRLRGNAMDENDLERQRRTVLAFLYVLSLLLGVWAGVVCNLPLTKLHPAVVVRVSSLLLIPFCLGCAWFCTVDAKLVDRYLVPLAKLGIFLSPAIGVPLYLRWARGLRGLVTVTLHGALLLLLWAVSTIVTGYLVYGEAFLDVGQ
jgi:hypothetical protein